MKKPKTILVVEDDEAVRKLVGRILTEAGYRVLAARDGGDAFLASEGHEGPIHLMVTDIVMDAHMNGIQLAQHMRILRPELQVLYMSGYPKNVNLRSDLQMTSEVFVAKPFSPEVLREKVGRLLNESPMAVL